MKRKILIEKSKNKIRTYLIEDDDIVEIHTSINEEQVPPGKLGDIYIGKVQNCPKYRCGIYRNYKRSKLLF